LTVRWPARSGRPASRVPLASAPNWVQDPAMRVSAPRGTHLLVQGALEQRMGVHTQPSPCSLSVITARRRNRWQRR
jgi:hypothetical protein